VINFDAVRGLVMRYWFLYSRSSFRVLDLFFWPMMDLFVWGFLSLYLMQSGRGAVPGFFLFLIGAIIFWNVLYRAQQAVTVSFLDDVWSRNLLNIFVAPVRASDFIAATYVSGLLQCLIVCVSMTVAAQLYHFNLLSLGAALMPLFVNLVLMGWSLGMMTMGMILRYGEMAEPLAWAVPYLLQPISAVFYPISVLPDWLKPVAYASPATYVFEGMRQVLRGEPLSPANLGSALALNALYMLLAALFFRHMFNEARKQGLLSKFGT